MLSILKVLLRLSTVLLLCASGMLSAQQTPPSPTPKSSDQPATTVSVDVKAVTVLATVRDKHGKIVSGLIKDDFMLQEDGKPVNIRYFSKDADLPFTLGLLVDTSMSQRTVLDQERAASGTFLEQMLHEKDSGFLIHFDHEVELLQDITSSRSKLEDSLALLHTAAPSGEDQPSDSGGSGQGSGSGGGNWPGAGHQHGQHHGGTQLYDAIYLAANELMKKQPGRKALIILSDGVDRGSKESLQSAIEAAERADTSVYCVLFKGEQDYGDNHGGFGYPGGGGGGGGMGGHHHGGGGQRYPQEDRPDGKKVMEQIAKETGGRFFEATKRQPLDQIYGSIEEDLRNQYSLGFTPDKADSGGYHKLVLTTKQNDTVIQTRDGFYLESTNSSD